MSSNIIYDPDRIVKLETAQDIAKGIIVGLVGSFTGIFLITGISTVLTAYKQTYDSKTASLKEGNILKAEIITKNYNNIQKNKIKNVVVDTNNNGIEDADDVVINGKLFTFSEAQEGRNVVFLQNEKRIKPLAVENENGKFDVKKTPSDIYYALNPEKVKSLKNLDDEFNNIIAQKTR